MAIEAFVSQARAIAFTCHNLLEFRSSNLSSSYFPKQFDLIMIGFVTSVSGISDSDIHKCQRIELKRVSHDDLPRDRLVFYSHWHRTLSEEDIIARGGDAYLP
ncbi:hypothetical protein [Agrobacterium rosae]|uniref:hypothetical protein n=1 Tax=Agrobacterium rosae TaxID=1972867 RepID=UPI002033E08E|nr:hypothetical protein [Agrobacterium rosae]MCM2435900.1 hypothetical protein [Agrobacterium rosae]